MNLNVNDAMRMSHLVSPAPMQQICCVPSSLLSAVVGFLGPYTALLEDGVRAALASHFITGEFLFSLVGMFLQLVNKVSREGLHVKCTVPSLFAFSLVQIVLTCVLLGNGFVGHSLC